MSSRSRARARACALALVLAGPAACWSQSWTRPDELWVEPPTLNSIGLEWRITGDDNRNATVQVSIEKRATPSGARPCHSFVCSVRRSAAACRGMGMAEHFNRYVAPNMFAGSILNLEPDTEYEARAGALRSGWGAQGTE